MSFDQNGPYDTRTLTKVFTFTSLALLAAFVWMVLADHSREWKQYQSAFFDIQRTRRQAAYNAAQRALERQRVIIVNKKRADDGTVLETDTFKGEWIQKDQSWVNVETGKEIPFSAIEGGKARIIPMAQYLEEEKAKADEAVAARSKEQSFWQAQLDKANGEFVKTDLVYKQQKSIKESKAYAYEHALMENSPNADKKYAALQAVSAKVAEYEEKRKFIEFKEFHGYVSSDAKYDQKGVANTDKTTFEGIVAKGVVGPFAGIEDNVLTIRGKGQFQLAADKADDLKAFLEVEAGKAQEIVALREGGKTVSAIVKPVRGLLGLKTRIAAISAEVKKLQRAQDGLTAELGRIKSALAKVDHSFVNDYFRNRPLLDFVSPTLKAEQTVVEDLRDDYFFAQIRKVDRCETCHLAIDKRDYTGYFVKLKNEKMLPAEDYSEDSASGTATITYKDGDTKTVPISDVDMHKEIDEVYKSHPNLDLFLTSLSAHPKEKFGCTICHEGEGRSMDFQHSAHTPHSEEQKHEWHEKYHWHKRHHWDHPQRRTQYMEASCLLCHENNRPVPQAPKLNFGREVWERASCVGCHKMKGYLDERKSGPDLRKLKDKLTREWVFTWLQNPADYRAKTNMPRFWFHDENVNMKDPELKKAQVDLDNTEIAAVTEYLFYQSNKFEISDEAKTPKGNASEGELLWEEKGCAGCHKIDGSDTLAVARSYAPNEYGPNLHNIGDKLNYSWLYSWLKNPQHYWAETNMPNLQLSNKEAHDLSAFLLTKKSKKVYKAVEPKAEVVDGLIKEYLAKEFSGDQIDGFLSGKAGSFFKFPEMDRSLNLGQKQDKLLYLGRQTLTRYGCYGCHYVGGMETRPGIGAELSNIGDKDLGKVDWGHTSEEELPRWREDWMRYKVKNPRYPDEGRYKTLGFLDRSRMPQFNLTEAERESLITFLAGHTEKSVPQTYKYNPSVRKRKQIDGAYQIQRKNCKACHMLDVDQITIRRYGVPEDEVDDELKVKGKTVEEWTEALDEEDAGLKARIAAADALGSVNAYVKLQEYYEGMDAEAETAPLREAIHGHLTRIRMAAGKEDFDVTGVVLFDNRYQRDDTGAIVRDAEGNPVKYSATEDDEVIKLPNGKVVPARGVAVVQVWEDCPDTAGKAAGDLMIVADNMAASPEVFYSDIVEIEPNKAGTESTIPDALREAYPNDFRKAEGTHYRARMRGGMAMEGVIAARMKRLGKDHPGKINADFDVSSTPSLAGAVVEAISYGAPHLRKEGEKVQAPWLRNFLLNPASKIRPWLEMRMPNYAMTSNEAQSISEYFAATDEDSVVIAAEDALEDLRAQMKKDRAAGKVWSRLEIQQKTDAVLEGLEASAYFDLTLADGALNYKVKGEVSKLAAIREKTKAYQASQEAKNPFWYSNGHDLFLKAQCLSCHVWEGRTPGKDDPSAWGPDLSRVGERIRPAWFTSWVHNPQGKIPGTKMSQQFARGYRDVLDAPIKEQIDCLKDWVYAGMKPAFEAYPQAVKSGEMVRLTSAMLPLDNIEKLYIVNPKGQLLSVSVADGSLIREKSEGRTSAFVINLTGAPGEYTIQTRKPGTNGPSRKSVGGTAIFEGRAKVKITK